MTFGEKKKIMSPSVQHNSPNNTECWMWQPTAGKIAGTEGRKDSRKYNKSGRRCPTLSPEIETVKWFNNFKKAKLLPQLKDPNQISEPNRLKCLGWPSLTWKFKKCTSQVIYIRTLGKRGKRQRYQVKRKMHKKVKSVRNKAKCDCWFLQFDLLWLRQRYWFIKIRRLCWN